MSRHTGGPWIVDGDKIDAPDGSGLVAFVYGVDNPRDDIRSEAMSNVSLIAAAPDMLAALETGLKSMSRFPVGSKGAIAVAAMEAAVAKAKGGV